MDRQSMIGLQKIDCNCNDCKYMERDFAVFQLWEAWNRDLQQEEFTRKVALAMRVADACTDEKGKQTLLAAVKSMKFLFDKSNLLQYGNCTKFNKPVSFIPNVCQLDTQECFEHRRV